MVVSHNADTFHLLPLLALALSVIINNAPPHTGTHNTETWSVSQSADRPALMLESAFEISHVSEVNSARTRACVGWMLIQMGYCKAE